MFFQYPFPAGWMLTEPILDSSYTSNTSYVPEPTSLHNYPPLFQPVNGYSFVSNSTPSYSFATPTCLGPSFQALQEFNFPPGSFSTSPFTSTSPCSTSGTSTSSPPSTESMSPKNISTSSASNDFTWRPPKPRACSNCYVSETCRWMNVKSEEGMLCNACFTYRRKYKRDRPLDVAMKYSKRRSKDGVKSSN